MNQGQLVEQKLTYSVIGAFYDVYNSLGFGFLEHVYKAALEWELRRLGHRVAREVGLVILYKGNEIAVQRLDMIVDDKLVVDIKSTIELPAAARRQLFNYLRASHLQVGLLLHFGLEPKFYRFVELHTKQGTQTKRCTDATDQTDATNPISSAEESSHNEPGQ